MRATVSFRRVTEFGVRNVDRDQQRLGNLLKLLVVRKYSPSRGYLDALELAIVERIVGAGGAAENLHDVIMPAHEAIRTEVGDLLFDVACYRVREGHFQPAPGFPGLVPGINLFGREARKRVEKRRIEIRPKRIARKIGDVQFIPRCLGRLSGECRARMIARLDDFAVQGLESEPVWNERYPTVRP